MAAPPPTWPPPTLLTVSGPQARATCGPCGPGKGGGCREVLASGRARVVQGSPLTALFPTPGLIDTCRECGARALELMGQLQEQQALLQARPGLVRTPLQGILQLGQVRRAAERGPGGGRWGRGPVSPYLLPAWAEQGLKCRACHCGAQVGERALPVWPPGSVGQPGQNPSTLPDSRMPHPPGAEAQEPGRASGGARGYGGQGDGSHICGHRRCRAED